MAVFFNFLSTSEEARGVRGLSPKAFCKVEKKAEADFSLFVSFDCDSLSEVVVKRRRK